MPQVVSASGVYQGYRGRQVISGLDMEFSEGIHGLVGPNGAGKTTLLNVLATATPPQRGTITIMGRELTSESIVRTARRDIGYLPQDFGYFPSFSVADFVRYSAWLREVPSGAADAETTRAIAAVGLESRASSKLKSLSGGMLRRAGIAGAIVGRPRLVLLDEPTVGLDPAQRLEFRQVLRSLAAGRAVVLSTHLVEDVAAVCDRVLVMAEGRIGFVGTPTGLVEQALPGASGDTPLERGYMSVLASMGAPD